jgi:uncharacterized protein YoxC
MTENASPILYFLIACLIVVAIFLMVRLRKVKRHIKQLHRTILILEGKEDVGLEKDRPDELGGADQ